MVLAHVLGNAPLRENNPARHSLPPELGGKLVQLGIEFTIPHQIAHVVNHAAKATVSTAVLKSIPSSS